VLKISWIDHITNDIVFRRTGEKRSFLEHLKKRRLNFIGHSLRHNGLMIRVIEGIIEGKNTKGMPPLEYIKQIKNYVNATFYHDLKSKAENRDEWRVASYQPNGC
jgi:hypothetical protein